jgi:hypothetical protein
VSRIPPPIPAYLKQPSFLARQTLKEAIHDVRLVGGVYLVLGALLMAMFVVRPRASGPLRIAVLADSVMLFGPGVWYLFAGNYLKRLQEWVVTVSIRIGVAQLAVIVLGVPIGALAAKGDFGMVIAPAIVACFFVPALIAVLFSLRRAGRMIRLLDSGGPAFQPVNVQQVLPADAPGEDRITAT